MGACNCRIGDALFPGAVVGIAIIVRCCRFGGAIAAGAEAALGFGVPPGLVESGVVVAGSCIFFWCGVRLQLGRRRRPIGLHRLRLLNARQLRAVEIAHALAHCRKRQAGQLLVERVMPARLVNDDEAIAAVAIGENEAALFERRLESLATVGALEAIENGGADLPHVGAEAAGFFFLGTTWRLGAVFWFPRAVELSQSKLALEFPRQLLEVVFIHAGIDHPHVFEVEAAPADMHVPFAVGVNMERHDARLAGEAEPLFLAVGDAHPLLGRELLAGGKARLGMKERLRRVGMAFGDLLQRLEGGNRIGAEVVEAARLDEFDALALLAGHEIPGKCAAVGMKITLRYSHGLRRPGWRRAARQAHPARR